MTGWYDPGQLLNTGVQVAVSGLLGTRSDFRVIESFGGDQDIFDYSSEPTLWFDYVADLGDGWDSTYTIASLLAAPVLHLSCRGAAGPSVDTERGRFLIMGGDEVYPTASRDRYLERLVAPYECALAETNDPHPALFAIPGNHDWYDGLVSFSRLFCQPRWIGGWRTCQRRSYFAIKLPGNWWLWAVDIQLESDIDQPQLDYFRGVAHKMHKGDRVILATAEPDWIYGNIYDERFQKNLAFLEKNILRDEAGAKLQVAIAGDLHHYRRHEADDGSKTQLITAGGGGAFLHPTYGPPVEHITVGKEPPMRYSLGKHPYPDERTSRKLLLRDLIFPVLNPKFGVVTGFLYLVIAWIYRNSVAQEFATIPHAPFSVTVQAFVKALIGSPAGAFWVVAVIAGFLAFTDTHSKPYRYIAGTLHALAHLAGIVLVTWAAVQIVKSVPKLQGNSLLQIGATAALLFVVGYAVGSLLMGMYLYVSLRFFRRHSNEAFSALRIPDYKSFVRMHLDAKGNLTIFPVGVEKVPRKWTRSTRPGPALVPADGARIEPFLIEEPIPITSSSA